MTLSPQKFREMVFQLLYSQTIGHPKTDAMLDLMMNELAVTRKNVKLAQERVEEITGKLSEIDPLIRSVSVSYDFERIQTVTKNILRLGAFELFFDDRIPPKVAIAEAMRLARKFGTPESSSFVNALLDHLYQASLGQETNLRTLQDKAEEWIKSEEETEQVVADLQKEQTTDQEPLSE